MWETIVILDGEGILSSHRLKVPGGWLVRSDISRSNGGGHCSQEFIPDPTHSWVLEGSIKDQN